MYRADLRTCPHCGRNIVAGIAAIHARLCLADPANRERLRQWLHETAEDGAIVPRQRYKRMSPDADLPNVKIVLDWFGDWPAVAAWAGLRYDPDVWKGKRRPQRRIVCEHCGSDYAAGSVASHQRVCVQSPAVRDEIMAMLAAYCDDGYMLTVAEYEAYSSDYTVPAFSTLILQLGSWVAVAEWAGLKPAQDNHDMYTIDHFEDAPTVMADDLAPDWGLAARTAWRVEARWDHVRKCWQPARMVQVWMLI